jgi:hypothetical protein
MARLCITLYQGRCAESGRRSRILSSCIDEVELLNCLAVRIDQYTKAHLIPELKGPIPDSRFQSDQGADGL